MAQRKMVARTNQIGLFDTTIMDNYILHIDSSARVDSAASKIGKHAKAARTTGWVMHRDIGMNEISNGNVASAGGQVQWDEPMGSHMLEMLGVLDTLDSIFPMLRTRKNAKPKVTIMVDNRTVVDCINAFVTNGTAAKWGRERGVWDRLDGHMRNIALSSKWERSHTLSNKSNFTADKIALGLRREAEVYGSLKPLHMQGIIMKATKERLGKNGFKKFNEHFFSGEATGILAGIENSVVLNIDTVLVKGNGNREKQTQWAISSDGKTDLRSPLVNASEGRPDLIESMSLAIFDYRMSEHFIHGKTVYVAGGHLGSIQNVFHKYINGSKELLVDEKGLYNLQTIFEGMDIVCLTDESRVPFLNSLSAARKGVLAVEKA